MKIPQGLTRSVVTVQIFHERLKTLTKESQRYNCEKGRACLGEGSLVLLTVIKEDEPHSGIILPSSKEASLKIGLGEQVSEDLLEITVLHPPGVTSFRDASCQGGSEGLAYAATLCLLPEGFLPSLKS